MGRIHDDVRATHLRVAPHEEKIISAFLSDFDINYARRLNILGRSLSAYILGCSSAVRDMFGFDQEILLVISNQDREQPRTVQAIARIFRERPFTDRVDPAEFFLISRDTDVERWTSDYVAEHPQSRTPIAINSTELEELGRDLWFVRNKIARQLYTRDLFDYQLPIDDDLFFFGRERLVSEIIDSIRKTQNRGIFGLRKTGKTSLLFKVQRDCIANGAAEIFYYDCKRPDVRQLRWREFLNVIVDDLADRFGRNKNAFGRYHPTERIIRALKAAPAGKKIGIIFDEIEYVTPFTVLDRHWAEDFIPFWQSLWAAQSEVRNTTFIVSGVNPQICEVDLIGDVQNPMFGIIKPNFLSGLDFPETLRMLRVLGNKMGIMFDGPALAYLFKRYGGHPLLTRLACSFMHHRMAEQGRERPTSLAEPALRQQQERIDQDIVFYCRHIVSELRQFYKDEYEMLEMLARGRVVDFLELSAEPEWIKHLVSYGLIQIDSSGKPEFKIPVIQRFLAAEAARRERTPELLALVAGEDRGSWLNRRINGVLNDARQLFKSASQKQMWLPYGGVSLPNSDRFSLVKVAVDDEALDHFLNVTYQVLVEPIGTSFFSNLKVNYPDLFRALHRVRVYRHSRMHTKLDPGVQKQFDDFVLQDFAGRRVSQLSEPAFAMQQVCVDELFGAIQFEINRLS